MRKEEGKTTRSLSRKIFDTFLDTLAKDKDFEETTVDRLNALSKTRKITIWHEIKKTIEPE
jgi:hypothetical protein